MSNAQAVKVLLRRRDYLEKNYAAGYFSPGKSEHRVAAELSALKLAIEALGGEIKPPRARSQEAR